MEKKLFVHESPDNVAVALADLEAGDNVEIEVKDESFRIRLRDNIPYGHKVALLDMKKDSKVIKYGEVIGVATKDVLKGSHVHTHNMKSLRY